MSAEKELGALLNQMDDVRESIIKTKQRSLTAARLEQAIWKIWGQCRINKDSLDSERHCRLIRETVDSAVADVQNRCEALAVELKSEGEKNKALRRENKELKKELAAFVDEQACPESSIATK